MSSKEDPMDIDPTLSDDSSFYGQYFPTTSSEIHADINPGDETEKGRLEQEAKTYDPELYWSTVHSKLLSTVQHELRAPAASADPKNKDQEHPTDSPSVLGKNQRGRREIIPHFLSRLPPSKTLSSDVGPWIWMFGPTSKSQLDQDIPTFLRKGTEILRTFEEESSSLRAAHDESGAKTTAGLTRKLNPLRRNLEKDILDAARESGVVYGKWMLFPSVREVDSTWKTVVTALEKGDLGDGAKVATDDGSGQSRLICIYTKDFGDRADIKRELRGMVDVGLVDEGDRPIYYKCDAYTHLEITSKNEYGLKASMYSSRDVLGGKI